MAAVALVFVGTLVIFFMMAIIVLNRIVKAGPNEVFVISGRRRWIMRPDGTRFVVGFRMMKGGRTFVWPFIERVDRLSLEVQPTDFQISGVYTSNGALLTVNGALQYKVGNTDVSIAMAAQNFLSKTPEQIGAAAAQVVEGHLRSVFGALADNDISSKRNELTAKIKDLASTDLADLGLEIVSLMIRGIQPA